MINDLINLYHKDTNNTDLTWKMIYSFYLDPDGESIKMQDDVVCTADGLISINRIFKMIGVGDDMVEEYNKYRKQPIIHFPRERNCGINVSRASTFGDRIDYTLFDLKNWYDLSTRDECKLLKTYNLPQTNKFLTNLGSFENLIEWLGVKGTFTNEHYEVYDIENGSNETISKYEEYFNREWTENYYKNLKKIIDCYMNKNNK